MLRPPLRASSRSVLLHAIPPDSRPSVLTHGRKDHAGAEPGSQACKMLEWNEEGVCADVGVHFVWEGSTRSDLARRQKNDVEKARQPGAAGGSELETIE